MMRAVDRRRFCALLVGAAAGVALAPPIARADTVALSWDMLIPRSSNSIVDEVLRSMEKAAQDAGLLGIIPHGGYTPPPLTGPGSLVDAYDGRDVSLPGYVVPLEFDGQGTRLFLLVPFYGACIHVPPPPPNQIVLVEAEAPYPLQDYFETVVAYGEFNRLQTETELAEVGYRISARKVEAYEPEY